MITPSFNLTATERVLPKLALDFTTASLDSRVTFTRTTGASNPATYVNSSGYIAAATNNQPRFDYNPVTLACNGLLIEESRSNELSYSDDFANAAWTPNNATISSNVVTSPDGTSNADKLIPNSGAVSYASVFRSRGIASQKTMSVYMKAAEKTVGWLGWLGGSNGAYFNLSTAQATTFGSGTAATITPAGNDWYRCSITYTYASGNGNIFVGCTDAVGSLSCTGNGSDGLYIWGHQYEAGAFATSYIPTTTAALTRNADVATMTGTNFSDWYNPTEGAMEFSYAMVGVKSTASQRLVQLDDGTETSRIANFITSSNSLQTTIVIPVGNPGSFNPPAVVITPNTIYTQAFAYKQNNCQSALDGVSREPPDTEVDIPTVTVWRVASSAAGVVSSNLWLRTLNYWPQRLLSAELAAFTK